MEAKEIISRLINGNMHYAEKTPNKDFEGILSGQSPQATLVSCSDSRVSSRIFDRDTVNYIFHIRNIGNQIATAEGSVDYGIKHLKTPVLIVLGHTNCGAIKAALEEYSNETPGIRGELDSLKKSLAKSFDDSAAIIRETKYAQLNVDFQVRYAIEKYREFIDSGELVVVGAMLDFNDVYSANRGEIFIVNVNGVTDEKKIKEMGELSGLDAQSAEVKVKRLTFQ